MKSGFIALVGRPNVGKSTLLNAIMGRKIAITSDKPQTTRNIIQGIYTDNDSQMIFIDTPGIHKPKNRLGKILNKEAYISMDDVDIILFLVDITENLGKGDKFIIDLFKNTSKPVILVINKIDRLPKSEILHKIEEYKDLYDFDEIVPVSAVKGDNIDRLISILKGKLTDNIKYYEDDVVTNVSNSFMISEIIREKILELTHEEVPHSVNVVTEDISYDKNVVNIKAMIVIDRENLKRIIIGKQGTMIKEIGRRARIEIEELLGKKVYLELFVKVIEKWRDREKYLNEIGYKDFKLDN
ncbi:gTPase Era [Clostridium sp. CAG:914]|jgi:GTP-binding protein Era|nr:gTPase Era [Clostridium sp. CAG:914]